MTNLSFLCQSVLKLKTAIFHFEFLAAKEQLKCTYVLSVHPWSNLSFFLFGSLSLLFCAHDRLLMTAVGSFLVTADDSLLMTAVCSFLVTAVGS